MSKKALYAGSFDPITNGHLDIIRRAAKLCDELVVGVVVNPGKNPFFTLEERKKLIEAVTSDIPNVSVGSFSGLLADYVNENNFDIVFRGLRSTSDLDAEMAMAQMNGRLYAGGAETVFLMTAPEYSFVSSSMMKEVFTLGGSIDGLVPEKVIEYMKEKLNGRNR